MNAVPVTDKLTLCRELARKIRIHVLRMVNRARCSHIGSNFSMAEIVAVLYGAVLRVDPERQDWEGRDRFILSKGHACAGVYAVLAERGFFPMEWLDRFYLDGSLLQGHITHHVPGVEASTGSLGHGLSIATGMALVGRRAAEPFRVFAVLSDGELDEGSVWEPALLAPHLKLDNLTVVVDYNKIQSIGRCQDVADLEPLTDKWRAFGWDVQEVDGHDVPALLAAFQAPLKAGKPRCVIAHTVKGKGVSFMEDKLIWHYYAPDPEEFAKALAELEAAP